MQMSENIRFFSFALDSAHEKFEVWNGPKAPAPNSPDIPDGNTYLTIFLVNRTYRLIRDLTQTELLTTDDINLRLKGIPYRTNCKTFYEICPNSHTGHDKSMTASGPKI